MVQLWTLARSFASKGFLPSTSSRSILSQNSHQNNHLVRNLHVSSQCYNRKKPTEAQDYEYGELPDTEDFQFDDHTVPALQYLRQVRYVRMFLRKAKFEAPKLKEKVTPFVPPKGKFAKFLHVEHLGEPHALDIRPTLIIDLKRLRESKIFTEPQIHKMLLICNNHYFHSSETLRFSSKKYPTYDENKLYLVKLWKRIEAEVKDSSDMFADIPLPVPKSRATRSHVSVEDISFPSSWTRPQKVPEVL